MKTPRVTWVVGWIELARGRTGVLLPVHAARRRQPCLDGGLYVRPPAAYVKGLACRTRAAPAMAGFSAAGPQIGLMWWAIAGVLFVLVVLGSAALRAWSSHAPVDLPDKTCPRCRAMTEMGEVTCPRCAFDFPLADVMAERAARRRAWYEAGAAPPGRRRDRASPRRETGES